MNKKIAMIAGLLICFGWLGVVYAEDKVVEKTILFLGDSITAAGGYVRSIAAELEKQAPSNSWLVVNHGRRSETFSNLSEAYHPGRRPCVLTRIDKELREIKPQWVVACYGINDGIYHPFNEKRFAAYQAGVQQFIKKVLASGSKVILLTSPPYARQGYFPREADDAAREAIVRKADAKAEAEAEKDRNKYGYRTPYEYYDYVMARYAKWLLTLNDGKNVWVVDLRTPMLPKMQESYGKDPIHPNAMGHSMMAESFLKQWPAIQEQGRGR